jgi:hypothetical protein
METNSALNQAVEILEQEIARLQNAVRLIKGEYSTPVLKPSITLTDTNTSVSGKTNLPEGYLPSWSLLQKAVYFIKKNNRFTHFAEIADQIIEAEGLLDVNRSELTSKIGIRLQPYRSAGKLVKLQTEKNNLFTYWGLDSWKDENGNVNSGYEPNSDYPKNNRFKKALEIF